MNGVRVRERGGGVKNRAASAPKSGVVATPPLRKWWCLPPKLPGTQFVSSGTTLSSSLESVSQADLPAAPTGATASRGQFRVDVLERMADAEPIWRGLEAHGLLMAYQRHDWVAGLLAAGAEPDGRVAIAVIRQDSNPVALLPLVIERRLGVARARLLGMRQSNSDWILCAPEFQPSPSELMAIFTGIAQAAGGFDALLLAGQATQCRGMPNPVLALPHAPAASNLYGVSIAGARIPYIADRLSAKRRNNIQRGRRRLEELLGPVRLVRVSDTSMLKRVHATFIEQRGARFDEMGVDNIFAQPPFPQFFLETAEASFGSRRPVLCAHALMAGDEIVATSWGTTAGDHYSQYINSTTSGPAGRYSLMAILIGELMDALLADGIESFDLGLGDFDYKVEWTEPQAVFDSIIPLTPKGQVFAALMRARGALKRLIKQTPALWNAARWARRQVFRIGRG